MNPWHFPFTPQPPGWHLDWDGLLGAFSWLRRLKNCPQDPIFHAEGDVLTHTRMVAQELVQNPAWRNLEDEARNILFASALLHDIAKPECTVEFGGRISSRGHAAKGAQTARRLLWFEEPILAGTPFSIREQIVGLVRFHGLPLFFLNRSPIERGLLEASLKVRLDWLALLSEADARGRICPDKWDLLERIGLFRELALEHRCLDQPFAFPSDHSRFLYFHKSGRIPIYHAYDDTWGEVVLMCALPGSGKDTWIAENLDLLDLPRVSLDDIRLELEVKPTDEQGTVVQLAKERAKVLLRSKTPFVWNATSITRQIRSGLITLFSDYGARVRLVYLEPPLAETLRRNRARAASVPENVISEMARRLEVPELTEAQRVDYIL